MAALWFPHAQSASIYKPMAPLTVAMEHCATFHLVTVGEESRLMRNTRVRGCASVYVCVYGHTCVCVCHKRHNIVVFLPTTFIRTKKVDVDEEKGVHKITRSQVMQRSLSMCVCVCARV